MSKVWLHGTYRIALPQALYDNRADHWSRIVANA